MPKCVCGHIETEHVPFARKTPCAHALCLCEDFDFGGEAGAVPSNPMQDEITWPKLKVSNEN